MSKLTPYQRIVRAAAKGVGVRLSADECARLGFQDCAIAAVAVNDDADDAGRRAYAKHTRSTGHDSIGIRGIDDDWSCAVAGCDWWTVWEGM